MILKNIYIYIVYMIQKCTKYNKNSITAEPNDFKIDSKSIITTPRLYRFRHKLLPLYQILDINFPPEIRVFRARQSP